MEHVPEVNAQLSEGSRFLQFQASRLHMQLREELERFGPLDSLRIVLDFERASITASRKVFPTGPVEGCGFHLATACNRKKDRIGMRKYIKGAHRDEKVVRWWSTVKGVIFLLNYLHRRLPALHRPTTPSGHEAYPMCCEFLQYMQSTWYERPFKDMWNKWGVTARTTNAAEAFHRLLGCLLQGKYPSMAMLLRRLQSCNTNARGDFLNMERVRLLISHEH
ncbi:unnamed protein product [Strongylus vulgaris]|uniref:MULE transposase domain-containing protein n=1 Tax=Strongylus vulgaris TaxID=40348 RepID=A0A3P7IST7_STRVU|nr:unnamed protein product [Strongylus vulgaris]